MCASNKMTGNLRGLLLLLSAARFMGAAPYTIDSSLQIFRNRAAVTLSILSLCFSVSLFGIVSIKYSVHSTAYGNSSLSGVISTTHHSLGLFIMTYAILYSVRYSTAMKWQCVLRTMAELDSNIGIGKYPLPIPTQYSSVVIIQVLLISVTLTEIILFQTNLRHLYFIPTFNWGLSYYYACFLGYFFFVAVLLLKRLFCKLNGHIVELAKELQDSQGKFKLNPSILSTVKWRIHRNIPVVQIPSRAHSEEIRIEREIPQLRRAYFKLQQTCLLIDEMFSPILLLLLFAYFTVDMIVILFVAVLAAKRPVMPLFQTALYAAASSLNAALSASVAWAAGSAAAAAALQLAAEGRPALEAQAQLLEAQLRAEPVAFSLGGLFPLDLRCYVGVLGSVIGYVVVIVQFSLPGPELRT